MQKFKIILLGEKYVHGRRKKEEDERKNNAKFSGHTTFVRTHSARANFLGSGLALEPFRNIKTSTLELFELST